MLKIEVRKITSKGGRRVYVCLEWFPQETPSRGNLLSSIFEKKTEENGVEIENYFALYIFSLYLYGYLDT